MQCERSDTSLAWCTYVSKKAIKNQMMAITTNNSTKVNAVRETVLRKLFMTTLPDGVSWKGNSSLQSGGANGSVAVALGRAGDRGRHIACLSKRVPIGNNH